MSTLRFASVQVDWGGRTTAPVDADYDGRLILLFGDFEWLFAVLLGEARLSSGELSCLGEDGRRATLAGRVGVSPAPIQPPPGWTVREWLTLNGELLGRSSSQARREAQSVLSALELSALSGHKVSELNGAESFAAHAAFAAVGSPELFVLGAPLLLPETRDYEVRLIRRLLEHGRVCLAARRRDPELWDLADVHAYCDVNGKTRLPRELVREVSGSYLVRAFPPFDGFAESLTARGATVTASGPGSWLVELPHGASAALVAESAAQVGVALAELVSVTEAR